MALPDQDEVIAFLGDARNHPGLDRPVERQETHGAIVFLAGDDVYKIKRAVRFSYMDFSTLERRRAIVHREIEINRPHAPRLYLGAVPIVRGADGRLSIGGDGEVIEWAVHMRRFARADLMSAVAARGGLTPALAQALADAVFEAHERAPPCAGADGAAAMAAIVAGLDRDLATVDIGHSPFRHEDFKVLAGRALARATPALQRRADAGFVRRCHGDLHLDNLVLWQGRPTVFDAIEFNEAFATIDTLYDLAFLLMDLDQRGCRAAANAVFNRYLWRARSQAIEADGLLAMPLFLALRSAIRGLVGAQRAQQRQKPAGIDDLARARSLLDAALHYLNPPGPRLVAIGGLSGTGKSTLAAALSPGIGATPGAVHVRTDLERKRLHGVADTERLPAEAYTPEASAHVYAVVLERAGAALAAGQSVIVDAVFARADERAAIEKVAAAFHIPFTGLWLDAPAEIMKARVDARQGDASDATAAVVDRQLAYDLGALDWHRIDAGGGADATFRAASKLFPD